MQRVVAERAGLGLHELLLAIGWFSYVLAWMLSQLKVVP